MEDLTESVYECSLPVEAHMICDLLGRAGIAARVDGEFLAGAGGELPLGSSIKVRVEPSKAAEAREVIGEWEKIQPSPEKTDPPRKVRSKSALWFVCGMAVGGVSIFLALRAPQNYTQADQDGDGAADTFYYYNGQVQSRTEQDRNADGRIDSRWFHDIHGVADRQEYDDDFDGRFEWRATLDGFMAEHVLDVDGNGNPERVQHYRYDVLRDVDIYRGGRVVARGIYNSERQISIEFDADGDGVFERRVNLDELGEPVPR